MWFGYMSSIFLSSTLLLMSGFFLHNWKVTKTAGSILLHRGIYCRYHWTNHTLRSILELGAWLAVMWTTYWNSLERNGIWYNLTTCSIYGNISGIAVCLTAEWLVPIVASSNTKNMSPKTLVIEKNIVMNSYMLFSMLWLTLMIIFQYCEYILFAVFLSTIASIVMILAGDFFARLETSKIAGNILQDRIQRPLYNWRWHFWRSAFEFTCWQSAIYISLFSTGNMIKSLQTGTFVGCLAVLVCDSFSRKGSAVKEFEIVSPQIVAKLHEILKNNVVSKKPKHVLKRTNRFRKLGLYTMEEVAKHNTLEDCWIVYKESVLDVSGWIRHPGGPTLLERFAGRDATDEIRMYHFDWVIENQLPGRCIGTVSDPPKPTEIQKDFRQLYKYFEEQGYFVPRLKDYAIKGMWIGFFYISVFVMVLCSDSNVVHLLAAAVLALAFHQDAFVGHDAGHNGVFCNRKNDARLGLLVGNFLSGITIDWWKATHNVHHAVPNSVYDDPDIAHLPMFAVSPKFFESIYNNYHKRVMPFDWAARNIFIPYQHYLYYPIMFFARYNLYAQSIIRLIKEPYIEDRIYSATSLAGFFIWYIYLVSNLNSKAMMFAFVVLSNGLSGILNVQITLSHFSMPTNQGEKEGFGGDFYSRNIMASMDIACSTWMDWFHGGLQFQTLHHVYPRMPRGNVRKSQPFIVALCQKHGIKYKIESFYDGNCEIISHLREMALKARVWSPHIWESVNAEG